MPRHHILSVRFPEAETPRPIESRLSAHLKTLRRARVGAEAQSGPMMLNQVQFDALFAGVDWRGIAVNTPRKPVIA